MSTTGPFGQKTFTALLDMVSARTPTPGGGSAAALAGALGASLACMAVRFSLKRKETPAETEAVLAALEQGLLDLSRRLTALADEDSAAYERVRAARKLPQTNEAETAARRKAVAAANEEAAEVPLRTLRLARDGLEMIHGATAALHRNLTTDAASGALLLRAAGRSAALNVRVNLVGDSSPRAVALQKEVGELLHRAELLERGIEAWTEGFLGGS